MEGVVDLKVELRILMEEIYEGTEVRIEETSSENIRKNFYTNS
jgi:hypothetical protein